MCQQKPEGYHQLIASCKTNNFHFNIENNYKYYHGFFLSRREQQPICFIMLHIIFCKSKFTVAFISHCKACLFQTMFILDTEICLFPICSSKDQHAKLAFIRPSYFVLVYLFICILCLIIASNTTLAYFLITKAILL